MPKIPHKWKEFYFYVLMVSGAFQIVERNKKKSLFTEQQLYMFKFYPTNITLFKVRMKMYSTPKL
jgi:hypothetical protein